MTFAHEQLALADITTDDPKATVLLLQEMLKHPDEGIKCWSALGLGQMRENAAPAVPALVEALAYEFKTPEEHTMAPEHPAAAALANIGEPAVTVLSRRCNQQEMSFGCVQRMRSAGCRRSVRHAPR